MTGGGDPEDALYAGSPDGFVTARDALARQLRADGDRAGAKTRESAAAPARRGLLAATTRTSATVPSAADPTLHTFGE